MERFLSAFEYKGESYEIILTKRLDGTYFLKDFKSGIPFSPFYYCINDLGFFDVNIKEELDRPSVLHFLIKQAENGARHWADHKYSYWQECVNA